jgi:hypothetical protein
LLLGLDEVAALLHLLLHEHGVLLVHARRCACRGALGRSTARILRWHLLLIVSRHLGRCIAKQVVVDQTRRWGSAGSRRVRLRRLTNPKVEVLVWASLLGCWTRSLALQKTEQEFTVSVRGLGSLGSLSCEKVLDADVGSSCAARRWSARGRSTGGRVVGTMLRRRVRVASAVGRLNGLGRHDVARRER